MLALCNNLKTEILLCLDFHLVMIPTRGNPYKGKSHLSAPISLKQDGCKTPDFPIQQCPEHVTKSGT